jgi:adenine/guanine/hypoxanthine permease
MKFLEHLFRLKENETSLRTEAIAGTTTFLTMAYIIFVNPTVLATDFAGQPTGMDPQAVMLASCVAAALATTLMGLFANYPIAQAPGMGNNYLFVSVVMGLAALGIPNAWQVALGIVFLSGVLFLLLSVFRVREAMIHCLSGSMRCAVSVGIGFFIAFIGLRNGGIVVESPGTAVALSKQLFRAGPAIFFFGLMVIAVLHVLRVQGSMLIGILAATGVALWTGQVAWPTTLIGLPQIETSAFWVMDIRTALTAACVPFVIMMLFTDVFDTVGTLVGVSERAGFMRDGKLPRASRALISDAAGTMVGAALGTSTVTSFIESAAGVEQGGRTGLANLFTAALFLSALLLAPLIALVASFPPVTAPALVIVGVFMAANVVKIDWDDMSEALPSLLIILGIPLTYSIADGLALGLVSYPVIKLFTGRIREVNGLMYLLAIVMLAYFVMVRQSGA